MSSAANERRSRLREQMKEFYGDPSAGKASASTTRHNATGVPPEMDLDSEYFSVTKYTTDLLRRESLKGLVEADTQLLRSVRRLDHELQELVYQNYAKFISATDTIRDMNSNVSEMDAKLDALSGNVAHVDELSHKVDSQLREHRGMIEDTITANRRLKKVQFLVGLPAAMQHLIDKESYHVCTKYWVAGDGFLSQHTAIASIAGIQTRCRELARDLYARIEKAMCSYPLDDPEAMEIIRRHVEDLRLLRATSLFQSGTEPAQAQGAFEEAVLRTLLRGVRENFQSSVVAAKRGIAAALAAPAEYGSVDFAALAAPLSKPDLREVLAQFKGACALLLLNTEKVHALLNRLDDVNSRQMARRVAEDMQPALMDILGPLGDRLIDLTSVVLRAVGAQGGAQLLAGQAESVKAVMDEAVEALCKQLRNIASTMRALGTLYLEAAKGQQARAYSGLVDRMICSVLQGCADDLERMSLQQPHTAAVARVMTGARAKALVAALPDSMRRQVENRAFALSRYVLGGIATTLIAHVNSSMANNTDVISPGSLTSALVSLEKAGVALQERFVVLQGQIELEAVLEGGLCNEKSAVDPVADSPAQGGGVPVCLIGLLAEWESLQDWLQPLPLPQPATASASTGSRSGGGAGGMYSTASGTTDSSYRYRPSGGGGMSGTSGALASAQQHRPYVSFTRRENAGLQSTVNRILTQQAAVWSTKPADGQVASTMRGVVFYLLKGLTDHVRWRVAVMDTNAFHRLQIGTTFLLRALLTPVKGTAVRAWAKTWDDAVTRQIQQQLDELCVSGYEKYEAKVPLTNNVVDKVLEEALQSAAESTRQASMGASFGQPRGPYDTSPEPTSAESGLASGNSSAPHSFVSATRTQAPEPGLASTAAAATATNPLGGGAGTVGSIAASSAARVVPAAVPTPATAPTSAFSTSRPSVSAASAPARGSAFATTSAVSASRDDERRHGGEEDEELLL